MSVQLTTLRRDGTTCYVADVRLASPALLRTALAENTFGRNVTDTVSELAGANGAVLAINGDFYGSLQKRLVPQKRGCLPGHRGLLGHGGCCW